MSDHEIKISEDQWRDVAVLIAAIGALEKADRELTGAKAPFGIGPKDRFFVDLQAGVIRVGVHTINTTE